MSEEFSEDLGMLRRAIEEPVPQMLLAEVASDNHARKIAAQVREWCEPTRDFAEVVFDANQDNAWQLWEKCHTNTAEWQDSDPPGLLLLTDMTVPNARTVHHNSDLSTSVGFWRAMNLLREKWDALPIQTIFLVTSQQYFLFTTEADHLKRWIPLKLHLIDENQTSLSISTPDGAFSQSEETSGDLDFDDNLSDKANAAEQWDALREREILAVGRNEKPETLARRHWLPLLAAAITLEKWPDAARYDEALGSVELPLSAHLRWLRLRAFFEYETGDLEKAFNTAQSRWELAKARGSRWDKMSALWTLRNLHQRQKNWDEVERVINEAFKINPNSFLFLNSYAQFLTTIRHDYDRAEEFYKRAIEVNPKNVNILRIYALFLIGFRQDYDRAEELYIQAIQLDPQNAPILGDYANLLTNVRKDYDRAEEFYKRAIEVNPKNDDHLSSYAQFLEKVRQDYDQAEEFYERAISLVPNHNTALNNYTRFLRNVRRDYDTIEKIYKRAIEVAPEDANLLSSFAVFLCQERGDFAEAIQYFRRAMESAPEAPQYVINYAALRLIEGEKVEGLSLLNKAAAMPELEDDHRIAVAFHRYIHFPHEIPDPLTHLKDLLQSGLRAEGWTFDLNIERAQKDGHPYVALLKALAKVISENTDLTSLDAFPEWEKA